MSMLENAVAAKHDQWNMEAELFCCQHGRNGGEFITRRWANGKLMAEVPGARCNQAIPAGRLAELKAAGWKIYVDASNRPTKLPVIYSESHGDFVYGQATLCVKQLDRAGTRYCLLAYVPAGFDDSPHVFCRGSLEDCRRGYAAARAWMVNNFPVRVAG